MIVNEPDKAGLFLSIRACQADKGVLRVFIPCPAELSATASETLEAALEQSFKGSVSDATPVFAVSYNRPGGSSMPGELEVFYDGRGRHDLDADKKQLVKALQEAKVKNADEQILNDAFDELYKMLRIREVKRNFDNPDRQR